MFKQTDIVLLKEFTEQSNPAQLGEKVKTQVAKLTHNLESHGLSHTQSKEIANKIARTAEGPISRQDWNTLESDRFSPTTHQALEAQGMSAEKVLSNPDQAETFVQEVFAREGVPNGNGGVDVPKGVTNGQYDLQKHGIDIVFADQDGIPNVSDVKKYNQASAAHLEDRGVTRLEPEVERWRQQRQSQAINYLEGHPETSNPDANDIRKPESLHYRQEIQRDVFHMDKDAQNQYFLKVEQMDDLWTQDRWLKLIKTQEGQERMRSIGVDERFLDVKKLSASPFCPEWQEILDRRSAVIVSSEQGQAGKQITNQAIFENRVKQVFQIEIRK